MKKQIASAVISLFVSFLFFIALLVTVQGSAYSSLAMLLGLKSLENPLLMYGLTLIFSGVLGANIYQLLVNKISVRFLYLEAVCYCVITCAIIMLKSPNVQEINVDVSDLLRSIIEYPVSVLINLLLFVPLGALTFKFCKSLPKAFFLALLSIVAIEAL